MQTIEKNECKFKDGYLPHGSEVCGEERCLVCIDGKWIGKQSLELGEC